MDRGPNLLNYVVEVGSQGAMRRCPPRRRPRVQATRSIPRTIRTTRFLKVNLELNGEPCRWFQAPSSTSAQQKNVRASTPSVFCIAAARMRICAPQRHRFRLMSCNGRRRRTTNRVQTSLQTTVGARIFLLMRRRSVGRTGLVLRRPLQLPSAQIVTCTGRWSGKMDKAQTRRQIDWRRVGEYLLGRSTLIGIASLMLLLISGYATWHGMRDFIIGVSGSAQPRRRRRAFHPQRYACGHCRRGADLPDVARPA